MNAPRPSLLRKRASRLAAVQAMYSEALIEKSTLPALLAAQMLQSWADSRANDTDDLPHASQPEMALLNKLIATAQAEHVRIEAAIEGHILPHWSRARMSLPLLAVLQVFAAETLAYPTRGRATLIDEYTEVAAQLVTDEELAYAHKAFNLLLESLRPAAA
ncbi:MAG: transcription antitermination factor NusB [Alphaproteobacteria bacterium]|nr:transcription antitermination factor NusB [Alphaproteobacteria bacterium]